MIKLIRSKKLKRVKRVPKVKNLNLKMRKKL